MHRLGYTQPAQRWIESRLDPAEPAKISTIYGQADSTQVDPYNQPAHRWIESQPALLNLIRFEPSMSRFTVPKSINTINLPIDGSNLGWPC